MPEILRAQEGALVGVIVGSKSDLPLTVPAFRVFDRFDIPYEVGIKSAHRTPEEMLEYSKQAKRRGLMVIAAAAGGSAHLPGMAASSSVLPVIGIPIEQGAITGQNEAVGSMIRMPDGAPLTIVGQNKAGLAAENLVRILALSNNDLSARYEASIQDLHDTVVADDRTLGEIGWMEFMDQQGLEYKR